MKIGQILGEILLRLMVLVGLVFWAILLTPIACMLTAALHLGTPRRSWL